LKLNKASLVLRFEFWAGNQEFLVREVKSRFRRVSTAAAVVLFVCSLVNGQDKRVDLTAGNIEISLELPAGLQPFSEQMMAMVREKGVPAKFIFRDPTSDLILAVNTFGNNADEKGLSHVVEEIKAAASKRGHEVRWLTNDLVTMNRKTWLRLSFQEGAPGEELINEYFVTDWLGKYVLFNFSLPTAQYESYKSTFERSARSVQLGLIADAAELNEGTAKDPGKKH
jgi:hypothetical protein